MEEKQNKKLTKIAQTHCFMLRGFCFDWVMQTHKAYKNILVNTVSFHALPLITFKAIYEIKGVTGRFSQEFQTQINQNYLCDGKPTVSATLLNPCVDKAGPYQKPKLRGLPAAGHVGWKRSPAPSRCCCTVSSGLMPQGPQALHISARAWQGWRGMEERKFA